MLVESACRPVFLVQLMLCHCTLCQCAIDRSPTMTGGVARESSGQGISDSDYEKNDNNHEMKYMIETKIRAGAEIDNAMT
jgi:hypothetical protein